MFIYNIILLIILYSLFSLICYYNSIYKCMHAHVHLFTSHHLHFLYLSLNYRRYRRALARLVRAFLSLPQRCTGHKRFRVLPSLTASLWVRFEAELMNFRVGAVTSNCSFQVFGVCNRCKRRCKGSNGRRSEGASDKKLVRRYQR